jgi:hypothetical protein
MMANAPPVSVSIGAGIKTVPRSVAAYPVPISVRGAIGNSAKISDREHGLYELTCGLDDLSSARLSWRVFVCNGIRKPSLECGAGLLRKYPKIMIGPRQ